MSVRITLSRDEVRTMALLIRRYLTAADRDPKFLEAVDSIIIKLLATGVGGRRRRRKQRS